LPQRLTRALPAAKGQAQASTEVLQTQRPDKKLMLDCALGGGVYDPCAESCPIQPRQKQTRPRPFQSRGRSPFSVFPTCADRRFSITSLENTSFEVPIPSIPFPSIQFNSVPFVRCPFIYCELPFPSDLQTNVKKGPYSDPDTSNLRYIS